MTYRAPPSKAPLYAPPRCAWHVRCGQCGHEVSTLYRLENSRAVSPVNEELYLCSKCGSISIFDNTLPDNLRKPSPKEADAIYEKVAKLIEEDDRAKATKVAKTTPTKP